MRLLEQYRFGGPEVLQVVDESRPTPGHAEVLVRVHAAGVNPVDWKTRRGNGYLHTMPVRLGWDVSGVVAEVGTRFKPGDGVFGMPWFPHTAGCYAEYMVAPARQLAAKPASMTHSEAGGLPMAGLTAWQSLVDIAQVKAGDRVLISGAAGGVGHLAVQIARARGAEVAATASPASHAFVRGLDAHEVLDYADAGIAAELDDFDIVFEPFGGADTHKWISAIRPGGQLIAFGAGADDVLPKLAAERSLDRDDARKTRWARTRGSREPLQPRPAPSHRQP
jgi:NADPH:quinone reductase-like Zn-dependent oxidoreductase